MNKKNKQERLIIVLDICKKLKKFPKSSLHLQDQYIDLYNSDFPAIKQLKDVFNEYINQDETCLSSLSGKIQFPEISRYIEYLLPINKNKDPVFVLRFIK
jgi:hypothetical protein